MAQSRKGTGAQCGVRKTVASGTGTVPAEAGRWRSKEKKNKKGGGARPVLITMNHLFTEITVPEH